MNNVFLFLLFSRAFTLNYMNTRNLVFAAFLFLVSCGQNDPNNTQNTQMEEKILPESIQTAGTMNGDRYFEYMGKKLFNGATFYNAHSFSNNGYCVVSQKTGDKELFGVIDSKGKTVIDFKYESLNGLPYVYYGYFLFSDKTNRTNGLIDTKGKVVIPAKYKEIGKFITEGTVQVGEAYNKWGLISMKNELIIPMQYNFVSAWSDGLIRVRKGSLEGYYNRSGQIVIPIQYTEATDFEKNMAMVQKGGKVGAINTKGETIIDFVYDNYLELVAVSKDEYTTSGFSESLMGFILEGGYIAVQKDGKWGYINTKGDVMIPFEFDQVWQPEKYDPNKVRIRKGDQRGHIDLKTKKVTYL